MFRAKLLTAQRPPPSAKPRICSPRLRPTPPIPVRVICCDDDTESALRPPSGMLSSLLSASAPEWLTGPWPAPYKQSLIVPVSRLCCESPIVSRNCDAPHASPRHTETDSRAKTPTPTPLELQASLVPLKGKLSQVCAIRSAHALTP